MSGLLSVGKMIPCREENSKRTHVLKPLQEVCYKGKGQLKMRRAADIIPSLTVYERKNGYTLDFMRSVAIFPFVTICAIFSLIPVLTVLFL